LTVSGVDRISRLEFGRFGESGKGATRNTGIRLQKALDDGTFHCI
jgi:hypothetical protein